MPDIRRTPQLDDFSGGFVDPITIAQGWRKADVTAWGANMWRSSGGALIGKAGDSKYAFMGKNFSGNNIEIWGETFDSADLTEGWRMALLKDIGGPSTVDGYSTRLAFEAGPTTLTINRLLNGAFTGLANVNVTSIVTNPPEFMMMRLTATHVEVWLADTTVTSWVLGASVADTTYRSNLHGCLGISTDDGTGPGWVSFGGGVPGSVTNLPQIIRRTHRRGGVWRP